jgi:hypothetical protein
MLLGHDLKYFVLMEIMRFMADLQAEPFIPHVERTDALTTAIMTQTRTIALIGTSHKYQRPGHPAEGEFRSLINQVCASSKHEQRKALNIRGKQDIEWEGFCCDWSPERVEEEVVASHTIRERYWLTQLLQLGSWPVLFVCGADHIHSFCAMLKSEGVNVDVVVHDWPTG